MITSQFENAARDEAAVVRAPAPSRPSSAYLSKVSCSFVESERGGEGRKSIRAQLSYTFDKSFVCVILFFGLLSGHTPDSCTENLLPRPGASERGSVQAGVVRECAGRSEGE